MTDPMDTYTHSEQRKEQRRKLKDRREDIRFEPSKAARRKNYGRRNSDGDIWDKHEE